MAKQNENSPQRHRDTEPVRILTRTTGSDQHTAWLENNPKFKATSTNRNEAAAHNLAIRYFLGSAWRAQLPAEEISKVSVESLGGGVFIGRYTELTSVHLTVRNGFVRFSGAAVSRNTRFFYTDPALSEYEGVEVIVYYNPNDMETARIFVSNTGKFICEARRSEPVELAH